MFVVGIDPGASGAIACINDKLEVVLLDDMPKQDIEYLKFISERASEYPLLSSVYIEDVHALPKQSTVATFAYGKNVGRCELLACRLGHGGYEKVSPIRWKKALGLTRIDGESKTDFKHRSIALAKELFPTVSKLLTSSKDGRAEALLIAYYGLKDRK